MNVTILDYVQNGLDLTLNSICVLFIVLLITFVLRSVFAISRKHYPKGPWGLPVVGHLPFFGQNPILTFNKWREKYGNVFRIRMGSWTTVVINGYDAIKEAAEKPSDDFSSRPSFTTQRILRDLYGEQSIVLGPFSQEYLDQKKLITATLRMFTNRLGTFSEDLIIDETNSLVDKLLSKDYSEPRSMQQDIQYTVGSILYQFLYGPGKEINVQEQLKAMIDAADEFLEFNGSGNPIDVMPWLRYVMPWKITQFRKIFTRTDEMVRQQIKEHSESFTRENVRDITDSFLAVKLDEKDNTEKTEGATRSSLLSTLHDLQGAGFDTTSITMQWLLLYMAEYPDVQKRVQKEIDDVTGSGGRVQYKARGRMVYTDATIQEVMRITTMLPFAVPKFTTRDTAVDGYDIDKDTVVFFNLHSVFSDKEFWGDPESFRPSRLITDDNHLDMAKCSRIMPFGIGRRRCVGEILAKMKTFLLFTAVLRRCTIVKPEGVVYNFEPVQGLVYSPHDYKVIVKER